MTAALILSLLLKSGLIAGAGLLASRLGGLRPVDRVDILRATTVLLLAMPVVTALLPSLDLSLLPAAVVPPASTFTPTSEPMWTGEMLSLGGVAVSGTMPWPSVSVLLLAAWATGVAALTLRLALGLHMLNRWTEAGDEVACLGWARSLARLAPGHAPRLISTDSIPGPLSWGTSPGVILIDRTSLSNPDSAPAVIAHEMGHLKRRDWVFLVLSRLTLAVFWFNPLVWVLHAHLVARSEETADAEALRTVDRQIYARTLVRLAVHPSPLVATAMAADTRSLKKRIACIMSDLPPTRRRPLTVALTLAGLAAVATPLAALELHGRAASAPASVTGTDPATALASADVSSETSTMPLTAPVAAAPLASAPVVTQTTRSSAVVHTNGITYISVPEGEPLPASSATRIYLRMADMPMPPAPPAPPLPPAPPTAPRFAPHPVPPLANAFAPPAPPAPPVPPAPPTWSYSVSNQNVVHRSWEDLRPEERRQIEAARAQAVQARAQASVTLRDAALARRDADQARRNADQARRAGDEARRQGDRARLEAIRARGDARTNMRQGAEQMRQGARQMREEGEKLRDPAYRAR